MYPLINHKEKHIKIKKITRGKIVNTENVNKVNLFLIY
jgi:hypothetical protein